MTSSARTDHASSRRRAHRHLPLPCARAFGAFADQRRIVAGDGGERVYWRACASLVASLAAGAREAGARTDAALFHTGALIATFHCVAPRCGTFDDQRRIVAGDEGGRDTLI